MNPAVSRKADRQPERAFGSRGKKRASQRSWRGLQDHQGRRRCTLFRPDGRPDADSASADEARWRVREGREEPPRQDRSRRQRRRFDRAPSQGAGPDRLFGRPGGGAQGCRRFRQDARAVRHSWRSDGNNLARTRTGSRRLPPCLRSTSCGRRSSALSRRRQPRSRRSSTPLPPRSPAWSRPTPPKAAKAAVKARLPNASFLRLEPKDKSHG